MRQSVRQPLTRSVSVMLPENPGSRVGKRAISARTLAAYRKTSYEVGGVAVTIGRRSRGFDRLLASYGVREAVFITAYNPHSRVAPSGWNRRMQSRLAEAVRRRPNLPATGSWRRWSEVHLVVFGDVRPACRLLRKYRQNAIVIARLRQPVRLCISSCDGLTTSNSWGWISER
jgi:hypothetical protein